ncbi:MAG: hypothetical protein RRZ42_06335 [Oscillospiraceae bacterium]
MAQMKVPSQRANNKLRLGSFLGCDLTQESANVSLSRSPDCPNIIRESVGKVRKRTGYQIKETFPDRINGVHFFSDGNTSIRIVHAGSCLYLANRTGAYPIAYAKGEAIYSDAADSFSQSVQVSKTLLIFDGKKLVLFGKHGGTEYSAVSAESRAYVPTIVLARTPSGGGKTHQPLNLIGSGQKESFAGTAADKSYQLTAKELNAAAVTVKKLNAAGGYDTLTENTDFTVNRVSGVVSFTAAPGISPKEGQDNVEITYHKTIGGYSDRINRCSIAALYGANGARDRAFAAGGAFSNYDYYCNMNDPTYWGDLWYSVIGQDSAKIMNYAIVGDKLATVLSGADNDTNIVLRSSSADKDGKVIFILSGSYQGIGSIGKYASGTLKAEPVFLTESGLYALTPSDVIGERYAQERSYYIRGRLERLFYENSDQLRSAYGCAWGDYFCLAVGDYIFLLDGLQPIAERNTPYSTRQYECYYWTGIGARVLYAGEALCFGTETGAICEFFRDYGNISSFSDNGRPIESYWKTPELFGDDFSYKKKFRRVALLIGTAAVTGADIYAIYDGIEELIHEDSGDARFFSYSNFSYSSFTYKTDRTPQPIYEKISIKPDNRKMQLMFKNSRNKQPFALYEAAVEFIERR